MVVVTGADTPAGAAHARSVAAAGARALVLCGDDGGELGDLARELGEGGTRTAVFLGDAAGDLVEMVHELFVAREQQETSERARRADR